MDRAGAYSFLDGAEEDDIPTSPGLPHTVQCFCKLTPRCPTCKTCMVCGGAGFTTELRHTPARGIKASKG
jgi:hypothetical protein